jgi:cytoskeletal protein CcmA (bactofilin family)
MKPFFLFNRRFYIPEGIEVNGNFVSEKEGGIAGIINGDVTVNAKLIIERQGIINGEIRVKDIIVKGKVNGNIHCTGKIITLKDALVSGNIYAAEAVIDKFSIVKGVFAHINLKKENQEDLAIENASAESPVIPDNFLPDEPQQNWF